MTAPLLEVRGLTRHFAVGRGVVRAVDGIGFDIAAGETLGLVGESGCGKTTTGRLVVRLIEPTSGSVRLDGIFLHSLDRAALRVARQSCQFIFQDPFGSSIRVRPWARSSANRWRSLVDCAARRQRVHELLEVWSVAGARGAASARILRRPAPAHRHRPRVGAAAEIHHVPCDEPVSALDVSVRAQVINLMRRLQREFGLTYLFIAHDLAVVRHISDRVAVMYLGEIVEIASKQSLFARPRHFFAGADGRRCQWRT